MNLAAREAGQGDPVVLLHGLFGQGRNLGLLARSLAPHRRVISLDLRNHGESAHAAGMDYRTLADDVRETLVKLDALPAALLGHSMGGKTAMALALRAPAEVTRLVVVDIAPVAYSGHGNEAVAAALAAIPLTAGLSRAGVIEALTPVVPDAAVRQFLAQNFVPGDPPHWRIGLAEIASGISDLEGWPEVPGVYSGPTLFLRGGRSTYVSDEIVPAITARFPTARIVTLPDAGHWPHVDAPDALSAEVSAFLLLRGC